MIEVEKFSFLHLTAEMMVYTTVSFCCKYKYYHSGEMLLEHHHFKKYGIQAGKTVVSAVAVIQSQS